MKYTTTFVAIGLALVAALSAPSAVAQNARSFVSSQGSDSNNCTLAAPCRTLAQAITLTNAGGEIDVLNTAGYGPLTINKAISIVNDGGIASIFPGSGGIGITINAGTSDAVSLRGLTIEGENLATTGIQFNTGQSLTIENCVIRHVTGDGIDFFPTASSGLSVSKSVVADNGQGGIWVYPSGSGAVTAVFNGVEVKNNYYGLDVDGSNSTGTLRATVSDSLVSGSVVSGFTANAASGHAPTTLMVVRSVAANNGWGLDGSGLHSQGTGATLYVAQSTVTENANGWTTYSSGVVYSYGDNYIDANSANTTAPPVIARK